MRLALTLAAAVLITGPAALSFAPPALAQTSFGSSRTVETRADWERETDRAISMALRRANSALASQGSAQSIGMVVRLEIARDGSLRDLRMLEGSGRPSLDASLIRAFSRDLGIPPFTRDMPEPSQVVTLQIGTVRH